MALRFHDLKVRDVVRETPDAVSLSFDLPEALREDYAFRPGQYLTLRAEVAGEDLRRSYSICAPLGTDSLRVGVKKVEGGRFSSFVCDALKPGDQIEVMTPEGRFGVEIGGAHDYLLIAAGSGVTPMLSIARSVLENEPESGVTFVYGNRATDSIMFREELEDLKDAHMGRFTLLHVLSREEQDVEILHGRVDAARVARLAETGLIAPTEMDGVFLCGPGEMIDAVGEALAGMGVDRRKIHFERFTPADDAPPPRPMSEAAKQAAAHHAEVVTIIDGSRKSFAIGEPGQTVLEAASAAGQEIPFSCAGGMCCTCRCRIVEGEGEMAVNYSLQPWEIEAGFTLACQTRPTSDRLVLDFDAV